MWANDGLFLFIFRKYFAEKECPGIIGFEGKHSVHKDQIVGLDQMTIVFLINQGT